MLYTVASAVLHSVWDTGSSIVTRPAPRNNLTTSAPRVTSTHMREVTNRRTSDPCSKQLISQTLDVRLRWV